MKIIKINAIWCPACLVMKKIWTKIESNYKDIEYINYDYDMDEDMVEKYNVGSILPVTIFFKGDKEVSRLNGEKKEEEIIKVIESTIGEK